VALRPSSLVVSGFAGEVEQGADFFFKFFGVERIFGDRHGCGSGSAMGESSSTTGIAVGVGTGIGECCAACSVAGLE